MYTDVIRWSEEVFQSIDNRRIYCAKKAELTFVPSRVHAFDEPLPSEQLKRFAITLTSRYYNGTRFARTWGEGAAFRSVLQAEPFSMFGSFDLPRVTPGRTPAPHPTVGDYEDEF
eukprot:Opistho-2@47371